MHDRKLLFGSKIAHHAFRQIQHRPDLRYAAAVEIGHGLEAAQTALKQQTHQERLHCVVIVMPQRNLMKALLQQCLIQCAAPHFCAH